MPFGFKYSMVYLPDFNRESFLLFVHNPAGATKLRDYSGDETRVLGQPRRQAVLGGTVEGRTRFLVEPHLTTDHRYWNLRTQEFNSRYLSSAQSVPGIRNGIPGQGSNRGRNGTRGLARRGSRRQLQDYVNEHETTLTNAVMDVLPPRLRKLGAHIRWV
jgi:hypothetical protein